MNQLEEFKSVQRLIRPDSTCGLYSLIIRKEDKSIIVGRVDSGIFVSVPQIGVNIIRLLQKGNSLREAKEQIYEKSGASVDVEGFVITLAKQGFIHSINSVQLQTSQKNASGAIPWLKQYHVSWIFTPPIYFGYFAVILFATLTVFSHLSLFPSYKDFFWMRSTSIVLLVNTLLFMLFAILHEFAHVIAARALNIPSTIRFGTRLHNLVLQSDVSGLWSVPKKYRYSVYLAGMEWNIFIASFFILTIAYVHLSPLLTSFIKLMVLINFYTLIPQFFLYMRTDLYFVMLNILGCHNLFNDTISYMCYRVNLLFRRTSGSIKNPIQNLPKHEQKAIKLYTWFVLIGSTISLTLFGFYSVPIIVRLYDRAYNSTVQGIFNYELEKFFDGAVTLLIEFTMLTLFVFIFIRSHKSFFLGQYKNLIRVIKK